MLVRSWQNLRVARLRRIFTCRYRVVFVFFFGVSDLSVCTAARKSLYVNVLLRVQALAFFLCA